MDPKHPCPIVPDFPNTEGVPAEWHKREADCFLDAIKKASEYVNQLSGIDRDKIIKNLQEFDHGDTCENLKKTGVTIEHFNKLRTILNSISKWGIAASLASTILSTCTETELEKVLSEINPEIAREITDSFLKQLKEEKKSAQNSLSDGKFSEGLLDYTSAVNLIYQVDISEKILSWTDKLELIDAIKLEMALYDQICSIKKEILAISDFYKKIVDEKSSIQAKNDIKEQNDVEDSVNIINNNVETLIKNFKKVILNHRANAIDFSRNEWYDGRSGLAIAISNFVI